MAFLLDDTYYEINKKTGISPFQTMLSMLGGSAIQTVGDNPVTAYRQLVQQYAKDLTGKAVNPKMAVSEANAVFMASPVSASLSGLTPRLIGVGFKRVPKFGFLIGYSQMFGEDHPGLAAATAASIMSAPFINPVRMIEKQQIAYFKTTGATKPIAEILKESQQKKFAPLFRGTIPLMGHSFASATLGLVGQPELKKYLARELGNKGFSSSTGANLIASALVSPIYVVITNPLSRLEVIMQTNSIKGEKIPVTSAVKEMLADMAQFGLRGIFRGQGIGIGKAIVSRSLTLFHEGREWIANSFKARNETVCPSAAPSSKPSSYPSDVPSATLLSQPPDAPSATPLSQPPDAPSATPLSQPSDAPSSKPSFKK